MKTQVYNLKTNPYKLRISRNLLLPWAVILMALFNATDALAAIYVGSGGDGSEANPYLVSTAADLLEWSASSLQAGGDNTYSGKHFSLTADIDLADQVWTRIKKFEGYFHGHGHAIKNLTRNTDETRNALFMLLVGSVDSLEVLNVNIVGKGPAGALAGVMTNGTVSNVYATGTITNTGDGTVENPCFGGLVGQLSAGSITNSVAKVNLTSTIKVGGIVGEINNASSDNTCSVTNCYSTGSLTYATSSAQYSGQLFGGIVGGVYRHLTIQYNVAINPTLSGNRWGVGRIRGENTGGGTGVTNSNNLAWTGQTGYNNSAGMLAARTTEELKMDTTYAAIGWSISTSPDPTKVWYINNGESFPVFQWQVPVISITTQPANADVTKGDISGSLSVAAEATRNEVTWSYQWYVNTEASNTGGTPIENATEATFTIPDDLESGKHYYYVVIGTTDGRTGATATKASDVATVTVIPTTTIWTENNWSDGLPGLTTDVTISDGFPTLPSDITVKSVIFKQGAGIDLNGHTLTATETVEVEYTLGSEKRWYAIGFPFAVTKVWSHKYETEGTPPYELTPTSTGSDNDYWLKIYNPESESKWSYANAIEAGKGYIVQFPTTFLNTKISFISDSEENIELSDDELSLTSSLQLLSNPKYKTFSPTQGEGNSYYYQYNLGENAFIRTEAGSIDVAPFESIIAVGGTESQQAPLRISVDVGTVTDMLTPRSTGDDPVIATRHYTLQGVEVVRPSETGLYIVRKQLKSGKETTTKIFFNKNK